MVSVIRKFVPSLSEREQEELPTPPSQRRRSTYNQIVQQGQAILYQNQCTFDKPKDLGTLKLLVEVYQDKIEVSSTNHSIHLGTVIMRRRYTLVFTLALLSTLVFGCNTRNFSNPAAPSATSASIVGLPVEDAAQTSFGKWSAANGEPYRDIQVTVLDNDDFFARLVLTVWFRSSSEAPWEERFAEVECRRIGETWQCDDDLSFRLTEGEQSRRDEMLAMEEAEALATEEALHAQATATEEALQAQARATEQARLAEYGTKIVSLNVAGNHNCALTDTGGVLCWGDNHYGQLGDGTTDRRSAPTPVTNLSSGVTSIAAGSNHNCALTNTGGILCWGWNGYGQLGSSEGEDTCTSTSDGSYSICYRTPVPVTNLSSGVIAIAAGGSHTCVLTDTGGVLCWGDNDSGQLGSNEGEDTCSPFDRNINNRTPCSLAPTPVTSLASGVTAIAAGYSHTCALTDTGGILCWGDNDNGQLGDGTTDDRSAPTPVTNLSSGVTSIHAGGYHNYALTDTGVLCWGDNRYGQLGDGTDDRSAPTPVTWPLVIY